MKKLSIDNLSYFMILWVLLAIGHPLAIALSYSLLKDFINIRPLKPLEEYIVDIVFFAIYIPALAVWKAATFRRSDFINLAQDLGVKFTNKLYYYSLIEVLGVYSFARGFWNNIYIVAKIDIPFFAYAGHKRVKLGTLKGEIEYSGGDTPEYMREESKIELFLLIKSPYDINVTLKIDDSKGTLPVTGCPEIDEAINSHLADTPYFNARLIFNNECLRMTIIGGSWEGRRFGEKIQKGFAMFQQLSNALSAKYPVESWDTHKIKWDRSEEAFYLVNN